jgi:hypothetical protein
MRFNFRLPGLGGSPPSPPPPPPPPPVIPTPDMNDPALIASRKRTAATAQARSGRISTALTGEDTGGTGTDTVG